MKRWWYILFGSAVVVILPLLGLPASVDRVAYMFIGISFILISLHNIRRGYLRDFVAFNTTTPSPAETPELYQEPTTPADEEVSI